MTRYEVYLNLYLTVVSKSQADPGNLDLLALADAMDPYAMPMEASKDTYIYDRFEALWLRLGTTYSPNNENLGLDFAKSFFGLLPQTDARFVAGKNAMATVTQKEWERVAMWNAVVGTYELLYALLLKAEKKVKGLAQILDGMDPFGGEAGSLSRNPKAFRDFMAFAYRKPEFEVDFELAQAYCYRDPDGLLAKGFFYVKPKDWDALRYEDPSSFRMRAA